MAWTTPRTWVTNEVVTSANMNTHVRDNLNFLFAPPVCSVKHSAGQSVTSGATVTLSADTENYDTDTMHSTVTNNSRITATTAGRYQFSAIHAWDAIAADGQLALLFRLNATTDHFVQTVRAINTASFGQTVSGLKVFTLAAADFVECRAFQSLGSTINVSLVEFNAMFVTG